ncbi:MAG: inositol 2-dehydrogenase [Hyphococcus sp.]|nr:MAG: inositol 2-dehydrogenase [Marinicaulis sp.]
MHQIALVGAGRIGAIHAGNVARHPRLKLACIVDASEDAAQSLAAATGAKACSLAEAIADNSVKGAIIASSTDTHLEFSIMAAKSGKAVFCEKPIDLCLEKVSNSASLFADADTAFLLGFNRRFDPNFMKLRSQLQNGAVGKIETIHITSHDPAPPPLSYIPKSGGLFRDMTIHDFDMARWLTGEEFIEVFAQGACLIDKRIEDHGDIDTAKILLKTASGRMVFISNSRRSGYGYDQRIEVFGSEGRIAAGNMYETTVEHWSQGGRNADKPLEFFLERYATAYESEIAHFADILDRSCKPSVTYDDGYKALLIGEAAIRSWKEKSPISISNA